MKERVLIGCMAIMSIAFVALGQTGDPQRQSSDSGAVSAQRAVSDQYCVACHNQQRPNGVALDRLDFARVSESPEAWERVVRKVRAGMMPPSGAPRPSRATLDTLVVWLENELDRSPARLLPPPGLHRLNRTEYTNAIRDLLALEIDATKFLPPDDSTRGFDNIAAALGLSPALLEAYSVAAGKISRLATGNVKAPTQTVYRLPEDTTQNYHVEGLPFGSRGGILIRHEFPADGEYAIKVVPVNRGLMGGAQAFGEVRGEKLEVLLDGERSALFDWDQEVVSDRGSGQTGTVDLRIPVKAGLHTVGVTFLATHYAPILDLNNQFLRSTIETGGLPGFTFFPHVGSVRIDGPYKAASSADDTPSRRAIFVCRPARANQEDACGQRIISALARRAFRKPAAAEDLRELTSLYQSGRKDGSFDQGIELALQGILAHPKFIYRIEGEPANLAADQAYPISDLELASRLSFFLWSTIPDDELIDLASQGKLQDPAVLERQVRRMLADPRSEALVNNFAGQWLQLRGLPASYPVVQLFPDFDDNLRQAFRREAELFFDSIVHEDRNVIDLLTADYTFVNERLAKHYGIPNVYGSRFRRVALGPELDARRGLLGKGAILTVSAQPNRTSLVGRGRWILANILGTQPPSPPPFAVPPLDATGEAGKVLTLRQQMEKHRAVEPCASCHKIMDPIGLSLENFDAIGKWRTEEEGSPIDASGMLVDGTRMNGVTDLRKALLTYSDQFVRNVTERLLTYAIGRGIEYYDMPVVRSIVRDAARNNNRFSSLVLGVVKSDAFRMNMKLTQSKRPDVAVRE
jgi:mono/diheme cytochrome c family protein